MELVENKPFIHAFSVSGNDDNLPENLGGFESIEAFQEFFALNTVAEHQKTFAQRFYSDEEIKEMDNQILEIAKDEIPKAKETLRDAEIKLVDAKKFKEGAFETYSALQTEMQDVAAEVKNGKTEIEIPANRINKVALKGKYYHYAYLDNGEVVLVKISFMTDSEKEELFSQSDKNEKFFETLKNGKNKGKTKQVS